VLPLILIPRIILDPAYVRRMAVCQLGTRQTGSSPHFRFFLSSTHVFFLVLQLVPTMLELNGAVRATWATLGLPSAFRTEHFVATLHLSAHRRPSQPPSLRVVSSGMSFICSLMTTIAGRSEFQPLRRIRATGYFCTTLYQRNRMK
jgi:hypothetical protein